MVSLCWKSQHIKSVFPFVWKVFLYLIVLVYFQILQRLGSIDFKDIVCDPAKLTQYLIFDSSRMNKFTLSNALCAIDDDLVSNITAELLKQLDISNIIRLVGILVIVDSDKADSFLNLLS